MRGFALVAAVAALALPMAAQAQDAAGDAAKGKQVFAKCQACHSLDAGTNKLGPSLHGLIGRASGAIDGFRYSDAMKNAHLTWDEATLDKYLSNPKALVPGTKMVFPGLPKEEDRLAVIAYLKEAGAS
ncbi:cytochrome c family protein [Inquilinus sp. YAF38]|uniref:c-type cytochrome n=1 Tax=Inquilinus sp. YAF38 TaxID=3233084 RepID=UPI003F92B226